MKKNNLEKSKLSKKALKGITGSDKVDICWEGFCIVRGTDEITLGLLDKTGYCC